MDLTVCVPFIVLTILIDLWLLLFVFASDGSVRLQQSDSTLHLPHQTGEG